MRAADLSGINHSPAPEDKLAEQVSSSAPRSGVMVAAGDVAVPFGPSARLCLRAVQPYKIQFFILHACALQICSCIFTRTEYGCTAVRPPVDR